jgi:S1-C subfamily serine protease
VAIFTETIARDFFLQPYPQRGAGTGVIIDPKGYIVTNSHVIKGAGKVEVTLNDGRSFKAANIVCDPWTDLAVVKIKAKNLPAAHFLNDSLKQLKVGDEVIAIGNALALPGGPTVTKGIVSYLGRSIQVQTRDYTIELNDLIQTDAAINPGNSGGPLVNMAGQVIGINTAIAQAENIGFAISTTSLLPIVQQLVRKGYIEHPWLGVSMTDVTPTIKSQNQLKVEKGAFILEVVKDSPAQRAGLEPGDVITHFAGQAVTGAKELQQITQQCQVGDEIEIAFYHGAEKRSTSAILAQRPPP